MHNAEIVIAGLLVAAAGLSALARVLAIPYPIVLATMVLVAIVAHELVDGMTWASAFTLGAIVSPTDPLAGATIMRGLEFPRRIISAVEGEGLFNDATALVAYKVAVAAVVSGTFSLAAAGLTFVAGAAGGIAIGLAVGWLIAEIRARTTDTQTSITISLFSGYAAFIPAEALGASGVLGAVTTGIYMGTGGRASFQRGSACRGFYFWEMLDYLLNASLFVLVGLQLRGVINRIDGHLPGRLPRGRPPSWGWSCSRGSSGDSRSRS